MRYCIMTVQRENRFVVIVIFITFIFNIIAFSGCMKVNESNKNIDDITLTIGLGPDNYDIQYPYIGYYNTQMESININIYNSLIEFNEKFEIMPSLAENWYNPNNLTWRFTLRNNVKFHNGYSFSGEDVKYTIEKIKEDNKNSVYRHFSGVKKINIINNFTVDIITEKPDPLLLNYLTYVFIISKQYYEESSNIPPIGTGPYKYSKYIANQSLELERFNGYWSEKPKYKNVTFNFYYNYYDKLDALCSETVDMIDYVDFDDAEGLGKRYGIKSVSQLSPIVYYLGFDFRKNNSCCFEEDNPVSDVSVRKAMYHAINISGIIDNIIFGYAEPLSQFVNSHIIGFNPDIDRLPYDLNVARQYMKDAGYENGFEIELDCFDIGFRKNVSLMISNQLSEINITVTVNVLSQNEFIQKVYINRNSAFYFFGWHFDTGDAGEIFNSILRSVDEKKGFGVSNFGYYSNPEIDNITQLINFEMNSNKRLDFMHEGFEIAMNDVVCIPLFEVKYIFLVQDKVSWKPRADMILRIEDIDIF